MIISVYLKQHNDVANKRRPRKGMPNNSKNYLFIELFDKTNYFKEQLVFITKQINQNNAALKSGVRLDWLVIWPLSQESIA